MSCTLLERNSKWPWFSAAAEHWPTLTIQFCGRHRPLQNRHGLASRTLEPISGRNAADQASIEMLLRIGRCLAPVTGRTNTAFVNTERSEEHTSELQSLMRISYAVF